MLASAFITRDVEVVVQGDGHLFALRGQVRPATAREGVMIMELYEQALEDDGAWEVLRQVILEWLPLRIASMLTSKTFKRENALRVAITLLSVGVTPAEQANHDEAEEKASEKVAREGWDSILRDYRHLVNGSLDEPWAYFVRQVAGLDRLRARAEASFMNAYLSSRAESAASRNRIFIRAGYKRAWEDMTEDEREAEANAGWAALYSQARGLA